jgi:hypothetical protein
VRCGGIEGVLVNTTVDGKYNKKHQIRDDAGEVRFVADPVTADGSNNRYAIELVADKLPTDVSTWETSALIHAVIVLATMTNERSTASWRKATVDERGMFWGALKAELNRRIPK